MEETLKRSYGFRKQVLVKETSTEVFTRKSVSYGGSGSCIITAEIF